MRSYRRPPRILDEHDREVPGDRICTIKADRQSTGMKAHARGWRPIEPSWFTPPGVGRKSWPRPLSGDTGHYRNMTDANLLFIEQPSDILEQFNEQLRISDSNSTPGTSFPSMRWRIRSCLELASILPTGAMCGPSAAILNPFVDRVLYCDINERLGSGFAVDGGVSRFARRSHLRAVVPPPGSGPVRLTAFARGSSPSDPGCAPSPGSQRNWR